MSIEYALTNIDPKVIEGKWLSESPTNPGCYWMHFAPGTLGWDNEPFQSIVKLDWAGKPGHSEFEIEYSLTDYETAEELEHIKVSELLEHGAKFWSIQVNEPPHFNSEN